jgi:hypothetical protein
VAHDWVAKATTLGFSDEKTMFQELYSDMSLQELSSSLGISPHLCRKKLTEHEIPIRKRGGPNSQKVVMNDEVVKAMAEKGANAVALEQGVSKYTLFKQKARFLAGKSTTEEGPEPVPAQPAVEPPAPKEV